MASIRPVLLAALPLAFVACGGDDGGTITPEGEHYHYVAKKVSVPTNNNQSREFGLDLDGKDPKPDNRLGMALATLKSAGGFDIQGTVDKSVAEGSITLLLDVQTKSFSSTSAAGIQVLLGENAMPAACNGAELYTCTTAVPPVCTGCGHHLAGTGMFTVGQQTAPLGGKIVNSVFSGGPGELGLQIALGGTGAINLHLIGARAKATGITDTGIESVILAGALTQEELDSQVLPAIATQVNKLLMDNCTALNSPPTCGCPTTGSTKTILDMFDGDVAGTTKDCNITVTEIKSSTLVATILEPDVMINGKAALSLGIMVEAVHATFTP